MRSNKNQWSSRSRRILFTISAGLAPLVVAAAGCGSVDSNTSGTSGGGGGGGAPIDGFDLPCDIVKTFEGKCWSCHGEKPVPGAPMSLVTYADLTAPAKTDATMTVAEKSLERMKSAAAPMPPGGGATAMDIASMEAWIAAGTPKESCGGATADPFSGKSLCTSAKTWTFGEDVSDPMRPQMHPGRPCNDCHSKGDPLDPPPIFAVAGTVYPTGHEPDECYGIDGAAQGSVIVRVTDSLDRVYDLPVNATGNFLLLDMPFDPPYSAKVISPKGERAMAAKQTSGDCNLCHTEAGGGYQSMAPGRIVMPL